MITDEKKLKRYVLDAMADMICGDEDKKYSCFPYRSSSRLTDFFKEDLELPYIHNGGTRKWWVLDVLQELNKDGFNQNNIISDTNLRVLQSIFDIKYFITNGHYKYKVEEKANEQIYSNYHQAIGIGNKVLQHAGIEVTKDINSDSVTINSLDKVILSTEPKALKSKKKFEVCPIVFNIPEDLKVDFNLISVMMPFHGKTNFSKVYEFIHKACVECGFNCQRADDIWEHSEVINDIVTLILRSRIVIVDFSDKNANVMYETGIAHLSGKIVIPITQSMEHVPFDVSHHRVSTYFPNEEGLLKLKNDLMKKLKFERNKIYNGVF